MAIGEKPNIPAIRGDDIGVSNLSCDDDRVMVFGTPDTSHITHPAGLLLMVALLR